MMVSKSNAIVRTMKYVTASFSLSNMMMSSSRSYSFLAAHSSSLSSQRGLPTCFVVVAPSVVYTNSGSCCGHNGVLGGGQTRSMAGGSRSPQQQEMIRARRRVERRRTMIVLGPKPPKVIIDPEQHKNYRRMEKLKKNPMSGDLEKILPHVEKFIVDVWLPTYPCGANLRKLQRDIAFRMQPSKYRPGKLPLQEIMAMVGYFERKGGILRSKAGAGGRVIIHHPEAEIFDAVVEVAADETTPSEVEYTF